MISSTTKILAILQWILIIFSIALGILNLLTRDIVEAQVNMLSSSFKLWGTIVFILYSILLSVYSYYMGKNTEESCTMSMKIKGDN